MRWHATESMIYNENVCACDTKEDQTFPYGPNTVIVLFQVFIGMVRPKTDTFITERRIEAHRMEYRTRHSVDGEIIQCEQKISLVIGYMAQEVFGLNAMNFMHRDDVRWVIIALRESEWIRFLSNLAN